MSTEFKDYIEDLSRAPAKSKDWNRWLLHKYPWMTPSNAWSGKRITDCAGEDGDTGFWPGSPDAHPEYDYEYTCADDFEDGWWDNFGLQMCEEIDKCLKQLSQEEYNDFRIVQIKEKYGTLRFYTNWTTKEIDKVISKYTNMTEDICKHCGKPATHISLGWISFYCKDCAPKGSMTLEEYYKEEESDNNNGEWTVVSIEPKIMR